MKTIRQRHHHLLAVGLSIAVAARTCHGEKGRSWISPRHRSLAFRDTRCVHPTISCTSPHFLPRGGSDAASINDEDDDEEIQRRQRIEEYEKLSKYRTNQQMLYQLRSTYLSEMLAARGVPLPTIMSVSTPEGEKPPEKVDWDCALSTDDDPKSCLYSFDAEPDTKVVAPIGTDQWISLSALNRLRRTDPTKVEPMWHSRYSILSSWFSDASEFSLLQHVGFKGFFISSILLDGGNGMVLRSLLILSILSTLILFMPVLEYIVGRIIVSAPFWAQWPTWGRIVRAGFPLKLLIGQLVWKGVASLFARVENEVREYIVDLECEILEDSVPVTVGVGAGDDMMDEEGLEEELLDESYDDEYDDDEY